MGSRVAAREPASALELPKEIIQHIFSIKLSVDADLWSDPDLELEMLRGRVRADQCC